MCINFHRSFFVKLFEPEMWVTGTWYTQSGMCTTEQPGHTWYLCSYYTNQTQKVREPIVLDPAFLYADYGNMSEHTLRARLSVKYNNKSASWYVCTLSFFLRGGSRWDPRTQAYCPIALYLSFKFIGGC